jgi:hypothetical protein
MKMMKGTVTGDLFVQSLKERKLPTQQEYTFLITVMGRYLMNNCSEYIFVILILRN